MHNSLNSRLGQFNIKNYFENNKNYFENKWSKNFVLSVFFLNFAYLLLA